MKKFFTLIACALVAGSAFAQNWTASETEGWEEKQVITNGTIKYNSKISGGDFSQYPATNLTNFVVNEWIDGVKANTATARVTVDPDQADAFAEAVAYEDPVGDFNYCIKVVSRDAPIVPDVDSETGEQKTDPETGEPLTKVQSIDAWDSQFFITFGADNTLDEGYKVKVTMKVKADKAAKATSQLHTAPGSYKHWAAIGDVNFTTEWADFENEFTVDGNGASCYTIALNLAELKEANTYYFDDINVVISREQAITDFTDWTSIIKNGDFEGDGNENFLVTQNATGDGRYWATIVDGIGNEDTKGVTAQSSGKEKQEWDSQFFVFFDKKLPSNTKVHLKFDYKAKEAAKVTTQTHKAPGSYNGNGIGDLSFTTEWQTYDKVVTMGNSAADLQTLVFNLAPDKKWNIFYFDNFVAEVQNDAYAALEDGAEFEAKGEQEVLPEDPLAAVKADLAAAIDKGKLFTDYLKTEESFAALTQAIADGEAEADNAEATQTTLEAAKDAIADAIDGLEYEGAEYTKLTKDMYFRYDDVEGNGDGAQQGCSYDLGISSGLPYGDGNVSEIMWADLSDYEKLIVVAAAGTPRFCMNRLEAGGQQAETQEESKMLDINPNNGYTWSTEKYQTKEGDNIYVIDLKAIVEDYGYARLHCIKGANWQNATVIDMILWDEETATPISTVKPAKAPVKAIFNLAGQQIKSLQKGLNIVDGKKVYVK